MSDLISCWRCHNIQRCRCGHENCVEACDLCNAPLDEPTHEPSCPRSEHVLADCTCPDVPEDTRPLDTSDDDAYQRLVDDGLADLF